MNKNTNTADKKIFFLKKGFSLMELMVVITMIIIVSTMIFANFPRMGSKISLDLLTQDIALTFRQAQVFGTTVMSGDSNTKNFDAYGVSFPDPMGGNSQFDGFYRYYLFADLSPYPELGQQNRVNVFNEGTNVCMENMANCNTSLSATKCGAPVRRGAFGENECFQSFAVTGTNRITALCLNYMTDTTVSWTKEKRISDCKSSSDTSIIRRPTQGSNVDIVYRRPKLQANITTRYGGGTDSEENRCDKIFCGEFGPLENVAIVVESNSGESRAVIVWGNGQISVDK